MRNLVVLLTITLLTVPGEATESLECKVEASIRDTVEKRWQGNHWNIIFDVEVFSIEGLGGTSTDWCVREADRNRQSSGLVRVSTGQATGRATLHDESRRWCRWTHLHADSSGPLSVSGRLTRS